MSWQEMEKNLKVAFEQTPGVLLIIPRLKADCPTLVHEEGILAVSLQGAARSLNNAMMLSVLTTELPRKRSLTS